MKVYDLASRSESGKIEEGYVDLNSSIYLPSPSGARSIDLNGESVRSVVSQRITTEIGKTYQLTFAVTAIGPASDHDNRLRVEASNIQEEIIVRKPSEWSMVNAQWEYRTVTFVADSTETLLNLLPMMA